MSVTKLPRGPAAGAVARSVLAERFGNRLADRELEDAQTVVSELVNNAYLHGTGSISLTLRLRGDLLRMEVTDRPDLAPSAPVRPCDSRPDRQS